MTLNTSVAVRLPAEHNLQPRQVLDKLVESLIAVGGPWAEDLSTDFFDPNPEYGPASTKLPKVKESAGEETGRIGTVVGQGFHAITDIDYRVDGAPLYLKDVTHRELYPEDYEPDEEYGDKLATPACTYELSMDTAYGARYSVAEGAMPGVTGCTSLHAAAIGLFNKWIVEQGGTLLWHDEYRGTWHDMDDAQGWADFAGSDREAQAWFHGTVLPAIAAKIVTEGLNQLGDGSAVVVKN